MASRFTKDPGRSRPYWLLITATPLIPAFLTALRSYLESRVGRGSADWGEVTFSFIDWLFLGALAPIIYVLARRYPVSRKRFGRAFLMHVMGALALCMVWALFGVLLGRLLHRFPGQGNLLVGYASWMLITIPWSMFIYLLFLGCVYAFMYYREAREREAQRARLAAQLAEARLGALRMQLHPHFLFNSLNAITVLVRDQNTRDASRMLELLSGVLRQVLQSKKRPEVTLNEELAFIEKYLAIEQVRFSDRLRVLWSIEPTTRAALVPEFILQPLVENAVRHGVAQRTEAGVIEVTAKESNGVVVLSVRDNGPGYRPDMDAGVGLTNTRERLATLYGDAGQLEIVAAEGGGTIATVRFPVRKKDDE
ncbi:MAG TPA: histidine kinase [Pyrinomonadaceae bacterium]|nr:histidine kinase [Pyrinomonadaceae bacterium]